VAAAKKEACVAWTAAAAAINSARRPFIESPPEWSDPITVNALAQAESGVLIQVEYLRQHVSLATPEEVAAPIADYIAAAIETVAADGQHADETVANVGARQSSSAGAKIRIACGS
jgi:hypothetical protein